MELIMEWPRLTAVVFATVIVFVGITIIAAIGHRRTQRLMAARAGTGGSNASGTGSGGQPPTVGGTQTPSEDDERGKIQKWWTGIRQSLKQENLWKNWLAFPTVMMVLISIVSGIVWLAFPPLKIGAYAIHWCLLAFLGLATWLFSRIEKVEPEQWGLKKFAGRIVQIFGRGPTLVPLGVFTLVRYPRMQFSIQVAAEETKPTLRLLDGIVPPEMLQQTRDTLDEPLEVNFAHPDQAKWTMDYLEDDKLTSEDKAVSKAMEDCIAQRREEYKDDPANARLTAKMRVTFLVRIEPTDDGIRRFAQAIGTPEKAILELNQLARAVVGRWCGKRTAAFVTRNLGLLGREILAAAEDLVGEETPTPMFLSDKQKHKVRTKERKSQVNKDPWGLDILKAEVHSPDLPSEVKTSIAGFAKKIADADGAKYELVRKGEGEAEARKAKGLAEAAAVAAMNAELTTDAGKFARAMEAAEKMVQAGNVVFSGDNPVAVAAAQIKAAFDAYQPPKTRQQPPTPQTQPPKGGTP